ncbi:YdaS family helix-turn-helix protein [Gluconobacter oxydans]|nr:hypothetical protein AD950_12245 [Gluconobacter oxydans]
MDTQDLIKLAGGSARMAAQLGLRSHASVIRWKRVPSRHLVTIERLYGVPREKLRPDLYAGLTIIRPMASRSLEKAA